MSDRPSRRTLGRVKIVAAERLCCRGTVLSRDRAVERAVLECYPPVPVNFCDCVSAKLISIQQRPKMNYFCLMIRPLEECLHPHKSNRQIATGHEVTTTKTIIIFTKTDLATGIISKKQV